MKWIAYIKNAQTKTLEYDVFIDRFGDVLDDVPFGIASTEIGAIEDLKAKGAKIVTGFSNNYAGHCEACGKPIFEDNFVTFKPTLFGTRTLSGESLHTGKSWYLHEKCYDTLVSNWGMSRKMIAHVRKNGAKKILDRIPKMFLAMNHIPGTRVYKNKPGTLYVRYTIKTGQVEYYTKGTFTPKEFDQVNNLIKLISREVRVF